MGPRGEVGAGAFPSGGACRRPRSPAGRPARLPGRRRRGRPRVRRSSRTQPPGTGRRGSSAAAYDSFPNDSTIRLPTAVGLQPQAEKMPGVSAQPLDAAAKRMALIACILGTTVVTVDSTSVNVALPSIAEELGGGLAGQQWTANAYLVTLSSLLLIGGSLGDLLGERRVFLTGVAGFGVTSLLCAMAPTIEALVVARALQGV